VLSGCLRRTSGPLTFGSVAEAVRVREQAYTGWPAPDLQFHFAHRVVNDNGLDEFDGPRVSRSGAGVLVDAHRSRAAAR